MANRLASESSPYLLQHAHNPVDWFPWGPEAFERARAEDRPILLSVGYSACHWCHVMERESFEDPAIAALMNARFVCIKVDREERPDVDAVYMSAVQALTGQGGWPMTVFLTPEGKPFHGGTYFPPADRFGMPGFPRVLASVADTYAEKRGAVADMGDRLVHQLAQLAAPQPSAGALAEATLENAVEELRGRFDPEWGGFGGAPKFPPSMSLELLLRRHARFGDAQALAMAEFTLEAMARGGIYDHLRGGFHRYSVDARWLVPHFEKMLYDNALLSHVYTLAHQATGRSLYRVVAEETLDYVLAEMTGPEGGFYATQDADSEGTEGKFFAWSAAEVRELLGPDDAPLVMAAYGITETGNFEGNNVLHLPRPLAEVADAHGVPLEHLLDVLEHGRMVLSAKREARVRPARDEKVITAWNGMMLRSFALAARAFDRPDYAAAAERNAAFVLSTLRGEAGLLRTYKDGQAKIPAFLEDHAHLVDGLLALYETTFEPRWLEHALDLAGEMLARFWDDDVRAFYDTAASADDLVLRPRDAFDNATPSGHSVAADVLLRLASLTGNAEWRERAVATLEAAGAFMARYPAGMGRMLCALDFHLAPVREVVLVSAGAPGPFEAMRHVTFGPYRPTLVAAGGTAEQLAALAARVPLLGERTARDGAATAYVCRNFACEAPTTDPAALERLLDAN